MGTATGAQLLVRMLKAEGVRHLFTLSGLHIAPIYAACVEEGIAIVDTRHECVSILLQMSRVDIAL